MSSSPAPLEYVISDVFLPAPLEAFPFPDPNSTTIIGDNATSLVHAVCAAAHTYSENVDNTLKPQWRSITRMLDNLKSSIQFSHLGDKDRIVSQLCGMQRGDILAFFNRVQDAGVIFRKQEHCTIYESFQASWDSHAILAGSYPEWAVEIPDEIFNDQHFQSELANFLVYADRMLVRETVSQSRTSYTRLLTSILRGVGYSVEVPRITKHVHSHYKFAFWHRSSLWLLIKVAIQTSLQDSLGGICYKAFMLHFMCNLAKDAMDSNLSSRLLHAISTKVLRRLRKLGSSVPDWLHEMVLKTCTSLRRILDVRWKEIEAAQHPPPMWEASQLDLDSDTQISLLACREYIRTSLSPLRLQPIRPSFFPKNLSRSTLNDTLSSNGIFFERSYRADPHVALYDVEHAVEQGIDEWIVGVTYLDQACVQLKTLMVKYLSYASQTYGGNPENTSIMLLTVIELWVALDKLVVEAVPMLADYSPEIPLELLHKPLFRKSADLHRLCRACQYLSARHTRSLSGRSVFSNEFAKVMFSIHYTVSDATPDFQYRVEQEGRTTLPDAKVIVFELLCPVSLHIWRSGTASLLDFFVECPSTGRTITPSADIAQLQLYLIDHQTSSDTGHVYLTCLTPGSWRPQDIFDDVSKDYRIGPIIALRGYFAYGLPSIRGLHRYINAASHTSNDILAAQAECSGDLALHEFVAFGHLRSGGSLQWFNILQDLRSRTLNFRRHDVHLLLAQAVSQVGPLDPSAVEWVWHREPQEFSFCCAILDELESLLMEVGARSLDGVMMGSITILLARLLASSPYGGVSDRAIGLLRCVRRKTFYWVQELSYDLMMAPINKERSKLLRDMAVTCRSTYDVGPTIIRKVLHSAEDVEALLSCAIFIRANSSTDSECSPEFSQLLLDRDRRLSFTLEGILRDLISADASDRGIDLAVRGVWSGYRSSPRGWQPLPHPNSHWLTCQTAPASSRCSQTVHVNLLDGSFLVDGKPIDGLSREIREQAAYKRIFGERVFLVVASDLPGMELSTLALISEHRVHFALLDGNLVIRAQHKNSADILEVIPHEELQGDLPTSFVQSHVHWLNLSTSVIEIRPLEKMWEQSSDNWRMDCASEQYCMYKGHECLVDIRSPSWKTVSSRLECLEIPENLVITTSPIDTPASLPAQRLSVILPRYGLSFFVNQNGDLESRDFKNMVYDGSQNIETLFGLENKLVLRPNLQVEEQLAHRCVIVPDGWFTREQRGHHVNVNINTRGSLATGTSIPTENTTEPSLLPVAYHTYSVDGDFGCLTGCGSWRSRLYLAHLHAQTSVDWRPDPLTGRTGIQEALRLLRSAGCRSIMELDIRQGDLELLSCNVHEMHPQMKFAIEEIRYLIERERFLRTDHGSGICPRRRPQMKAVYARAQQTACLLPFECTRLMSVPTGTRHLGPEEHDSFAYTVSLAVYHWLLNARNGPEPRDGTKSLTWASVHSHLSISDVYAFLQEAKEIPPQRFRPLFLLPTTVYCKEDPRPPFTLILTALTRQFLLEAPTHHAGPRLLDASGLPLEALRNCFNNAQLRRTIPPSFATREQLIPPAATLETSLASYPYDAKKLNTDLRKLFSDHRSPKFKSGLARHVISSTAWPISHAPNPPFEARRRTPGRMTLTELLGDRSAPKLPAPSRLQRYGPHGDRLSSDPQTHLLNQLFASFRVDKTNPSFQQQYISRLHVSARHVRDASRTTCGTIRKPSIKELQKHYIQCRDNYMAGLTAVKVELGPIDDLEHALDQAGQWPETTPNALFPCLASTSPVKLPDNWKNSLVSLALLLLELQRARRLLQYALDDVEEELFRELENEGCDGWYAEDYPDWLLIQLQGNLLIRGAQADAATQMVSPPSGENSAIQVDMGEGKSSVILPISAASLADGNQLVRVIVPKALATQMFRLLVDRLGGLANRPIYHLPFSRSITGRYTHQQLESLQEFMSECMRDGGIMVVQPEHAVSLKLTSVEKQLPKYLRSNGNEDSKFLGSFLDLDSGGALVELQRFVDAHSRDILDENDEVLHPRFQLIYTVGPQRNMEGYPDRWTITQQILRLVRKHTLSLSHDLPDVIEYELGPSGAFPRIRILRASDARQRLISLIVDDVMNGYLPSFSLRDVDHDPRLRPAVRLFISSKDVLQRTGRMVEEYGRRSTLWDGMLLLRGLLASNILLFALAERRWRVDYGLAPTRTMLAVPYRAKDVPAPRAEFGHPDIAIVLTCLSYYYGGLTEEQLRTSFEILQEQDDPSVEYANWLRDYDANSVPDCIRDLKNVNTKSSEQWDRHLFPLFARNQGAVDLYLSRVVFPTEAKEFPRKLAASSWDLAEKRERPITGFSGTNDSQYLLPAYITQRELDHQRRTNARVLSHLLQSENSSYELISHAKGKRRTTVELLKFVIDQAPEIRVFLDVGAQIMDFSNYQVAKAWLGLSPRADGAIYFSEDDEPMVLTKDGTSRSLVSSPFAQQLDRCIVYLDDAHTRGVDFKFPTGFRAAVTLGPQVTKDRLVQGNGVFITVSIGESKTTDILRWAIQETWTDIQERAPHWAQQGVRHKSRYDAWTSFCSSKLTREQLADVWLQSDLRSLRNLYAPFQTKNEPSYSSILDDHSEIQQHCISLGVLKLPEAQMDEEQERELNREIEREREVKRWQYNAEPAEHYVDPDVLAFVRTGVIPRLNASNAFQPISEALEGTSATATGARIWSPFLLATSDFCKTVVPASCQGKMDQYLRPVQWVLSGRIGLDRVLILLSPFEAERLMPEIRVSEHVHLHVYSPCTSERIKPTNDLMFYSVPPLPEHWTPPWDLIDQLNVFAGQLYLKDYETYLRLRRFLGIQANNLPKDFGRAIRRNTITPGILEEIGDAIKDSPLPSVVMLLAIRRRGLPFAETHMGRILQGQLLTEKDFENPAWKKAGRSTALSGPSKREWQTVGPSSSDVGENSGRPHKRLRAGVSANDHRHWN